MTSRLKKLIIFIIAIICSGFFWFYTQAAEVNQGVTVDVNVPAPGSQGGGGTGGGPGGSDVPPVIFAVASSTSFTTATVTWSATDDLAVSSSAFVYGLTNSYGSSGVVTGNYRTDLSGLATGTLYFFKISVIDTKPQTTEFTGTFSTSPEPPDITPPIISNVQVATGITTSSIKWNTNELSDSQINYGLTSAYGTNYFDSAGTLAHSALLSNLTANTLYHFQIISTDSSGNSRNTSDSTFTTAPDNVPPPDVSNFVLTTTSNSIVLSWINPSLSGTPDFTQIKIVRKVGSASANPNDGTTVYTGTGENFTDTNVLVNIDYFYTIFSFDTSNNSSPGNFKSGRLVSSPTPPPAEICGNGFDDNNNGQIDCADSACASLPECNVVPPPTSTSIGPEICNNGADDDFNGKVDCADSACTGFSGCVVSVPVCRNGLDDDNDGKTDFPVDPGCDNADDNDEYDPPEPTVPDFAKINLSDLNLLAGNRQIKLIPVGEQVTGLSGANLTVAIGEKVLASAPKTMVLRVGDTDQHQFVYNVADKMYYADISFGSVGVLQSYVEIDYDSGQMDSVGFKLNSLPWGQVVDGKGLSVSGVEVMLLETNGTAVNMGFYGQINPIISDANGSFGWLVPNKDFRIDLYKDGYYSRSINISDVDNNVINSKIILIAQPKKIILEIDPEATIQENVVNIVKSLTEQTKVLTDITVQKIQDAASDPEVQKVNQQVVAPTAITVVLAGAIPLISWLDFLPFLRLLFLQPLMLLGWRKRAKWGLVYNALNKLPVDLATVRLINLETNRVVQSKVTDGKGRFIFMVNPGKYRLEVQKNNFIFPSKFLEGYKGDGQKVDIYHGEAIEVLKPASITASVPLDPMGAQKKPARLVWEKIARRLQVVISWSGIFITAASLYISPKWYIAALLGVHIVFFFIFRRLALPPKPKNWGIISDDTNKAPIGRVIARLFNSQFNKLVDTQITDADGKYYFMAGDSKYYITYEHKAYHPQKTDIIDLEGKDADVLTVDVRLKKN
ncbi:MAG: Uncharacterized protein G01um101413_861 [Parcubacteria group bacterium Gr01-1014_13]|nr:MAG: Uncharacterized protein G01um101413_861 [Parcubacteria group bacterium Gr01-1014_13]